MNIKYLFLGLSLYSLPIHGDITKIATSYPSESAYVFANGEQLSGQQFQTEGIMTYKDYQYTVYYNSDRNVCISRRKLPSCDWQEVVLPYKNTADDAHNVIVMGICPNDGTIHLAYDHHNDDLHYSFSINGSANDPDNMIWGKESFSSTTNIMDAPVSNVTYPRFITKPDGNLLFECRYRWSGYGDSYLREYNAENKEWTLIGRYIQGEDVTPDACAYINGITYCKNGKLHITWCWRDDFGGGSNHDFWYAYSPDDGRTWLNSQKTEIAVTEFMEPVFANTTGTCIGQTKVEFMVEKIDHFRGYINQETQDIDSHGRIFAVNSHLPDDERPIKNWDEARKKSCLYLRFLNNNGTWTKKQIKVNGSPINSTRRVHLAFDSLDNAFIIANGAGIFMGTPDDEYENWQKLSEDGSSGFYSEPLVDKNLLKDKGILSIVYLSEDNKITVMDYSVNLKKK